MLLYDTLGIGAGDEAATFQSYPRAFQIGCISTDQVEYEMTVAMAAFAGSSNIVTVSDARLSYGEMIPASDAATMKNRRIGRRWGVMFAAEDATAFSPVVVSLRALTGSLHPDKADDQTFETVSEAIQAAYEKEHGERFFREHLARFEMGKDLYHQYFMELAKYDLGLELLAYGFDGAGRSYIFEVANPGKVIRHNLRGFAAIGSGSLMALAALNRKPKGSGLSETIYRLLDAKFSSETARDVGHKTYLITLTSDGNFKIMKQSAIEAVRKIWDAVQNQPEPAEAIEAIEDDDAYVQTKGSKEPPEQ